MSKTILVISTSPRAGGNSDRMADEWIRGAREAGNIVEKVALREHTVGFCRGCLTCQRTRRCIVGDDGNDIVGRMLGADILVFATPIYYYGMCGQMKTMLDRSNPLYSDDYRFREVYLLAAAAEEAESTVDGAVTGLQGWISCFDGVRLAGTLFAGGVTQPGEIEGHPALKEAYEMGASVR